MSGELLLFSGDGYDFVGRLERISFTTEGSHTLAVLIPKEDYDSAVFGGMVQTAVFAFLLLFFATACCLYFARRFLKPVYEDMERLRAEVPERAQMTFDEFRPLSETITAREETHKALVTTLEGEKAELQSQYDETQSRLEFVQRDAKDLADKQKDRVDPDLFRQYKEHLGSLTKAERRIYDAYISGMNFPEIAATFTAKESTLRSQTQSVYKKFSGAATPPLCVRSRKRRSGWDGEISGHNKIMSMLIQREISANCCFFSDFQYFSLPNRWQLVFALWNRAGSV